MTFSFPYCWTRNSPFVRCVVHHMVYLFLISLDGLTMSYFWV